MSPAAEHPSATHRRPALRPVLLIALFCLLACGAWLVARAFLTPDISGFRSAGQQWTPYGGAWELINNVMRNNSDERGAKLLAGRSIWRDYSVEADVALLGTYGDSGLIVRAREPEEGVDSYRGYFAGLRTLDNTLIVGRSDFGWEEYKATPIPGNLRPRQFYHLRVIAAGCTIAVRVELPGGGSVVDGVEVPHCVRSGQVGLKSYQTPAMWRNLRVRPATRADVDFLMAGKPLRSLQNGLLHGTAEPVNDMGPIQEDALDHRLEGNSKPISQLRLLAPATPTQSSIHGVVRLLTPLLYVEDATGGIAIESQDAPALAIGDEVEMTGSVSFAAGQLVMRNAHVKILASSSPSSPPMITADAAATGTEDGRLVVLSGTLLRLWQASPIQQVLELESGGEVFRALVEPNRYGGRLRTLTPRSELQLTGVIRSDPDFAGDGAFAVLVSPVEGSVRVLHEAPWWTPTHFMLLVLALLAVVIVGAALYNRLKHRYIMQILQERELLAHDLHDTVSQSFAGIGFQLRALQDTLPDSSSSLPLRELERAQTMVRDSHEELRRSITTLRIEIGSLEDLGKALDRCAHRLVAGSSVRVEVSCMGTPRRLPLKIADCFFRIGQEAISNAVLHSGASELRIRLQYAMPRLTLEVADNGIGMPEDGESSGFGLFGMAKRAEMAGVRLTVRSCSPGTSVFLEADLPRPLQLFSTSFRSALKHPPGKGHLRAEQDSFTDRG